MPSDRELETKAPELPRRGNPEHLVVRIHLRHVVIDDYSIGDDRNFLLAGFAAAGILPVVQTESPCG